MNHKLCVLILSIIFVISFFSGCNTAAENSNISDTSAPSSNTSSLTESQNSLQQNTQQGDVSINSTVSTPTNSEASNTTENKNDNNQSNTTEDNQNNNDNNNIQPPAPVQPDLTTTYEAYHAMTSSEQLAFFNKFSSIEAFFEWYNAAKAEYEKNNPDKELGDGPIEFGGLN